MEKSTKALALRPFAVSRERLVTELLRAKKGRDDLSSRRHNP